MNWRCYYWCDWGFSAAAGVLAAVLCVVDVPVGGGGREAGEVLGGVVGGGGQRTGPLSEKWLLTFDLVG